MIYNFQKFFLFIVLILVTNTMLSQEFSGKAIYIQKKIFKPSNNRSQEENEKKAERLRKLYEQEMSLVFNKSESYYMEVPSLKNEENKYYRMGTAAAGGGYISSGIYKNIETNTFTEQREYLGKLFLVNDSLPVVKWNLSKESKQIGEHLVIKATTTVSLTVDSFSRNSIDDANFIVTAWFAPSIPVPHGPHYFQGLPGLILELHAKDTIFLCKSLNLNKEEAPSISPKNKGDKVSEYEFKEIIQAKKEERKF